MKKRSKHKINKPALIVVILFVYLVFSFLYYIWNLPIKNIYIKGNTFVSDATIIEEAGIKNYPSLMKISRRKVKKKLLKNEYINNVKIKKSLSGKITIIIDESKPLFYNKSINKVVLLNGNTVDSYLGQIPIMINSAPSDIYDELVRRFSEVKYDIVLQISEIEYAPDIINEKVIDPNRFLLRMKDGNSVYINPINIKRLNNYFEVYDRLPEGAKGTLYFDSNSDNNMFKMYGSTKPAEEVTNE